MICWEKRLLFGRLSKLTNAAACTVCSQLVYLTVQVSVHSDAFYGAHGLVQSRVNEYRLATVPSICVCLPLVW